MSRFPITDPPGADGLYAFVEVAPGRVMAVADTHTPADPYGPYLVRDGGSLKDVPFAVKWPVSAALAKAGLHDTYREAHPDPVAVPGFTWTPGGPETDEHEVYDRIDWVLRAGPSSTIDSTVVGETGGADVGVGLSPYPTDHRGVVSTLDVRPAVPPVLVAPATRRVTIGRTLRSPTTPPAGRVSAWRCATGAAGSRPLHPGKYVVRLLPDDGTVSVAESKVFTVT